MITAAHVQHAFASHRLALHRFAQSPELCDRSACTGMDIWGGRFVYLATADRTDFMVVVLPTARDAARIAKTAPAAVRRQNALLIYLRSASSRLAIVRRIFSGL